MALTALQALTEAAAAEAKTWDATIAGNDDGASDLREAEKFQLVTKVNEALRWWWKEHCRNFAWPETVSVDTSVDVTSGAITLSDLGEASWASLWDGDPRPDGNTAKAIGFVRSGDKIHPRDGTGTAPATVFAFYRAACPQITYLAAGTYASPSNIPNVCLLPVVLYANGNRLRSQGQFKEGNAQIERAMRLYEDRQSDLKNGTGLVWNVPEAGAIE
jgi:hypothetical protein